jgi:hypothetical protein
MRSQFFGEKLLPGTGMAQRNYARLARVEGVEASKGEVTIAWLDAPGITKATYSQPDCTIYAPPVEGTVCLVALGAGNIPHIMRFIPLGYATRVKEAKMRQVNPGEVFVESMTGVVDGAKVPIRTGTDLYMNNSGDLTITTAYGDTFQIRRDDNMLMQKFANWELQAEAGRLFMGVVRRVIGAGTAAVTKIITSNNVPIAAGGTPLAEFRLSITEKSDTDPAAEPGTDDPIVEVIAGSCIDETGLQIYSETGDKTVLKVRTRNDDMALEVDDKGNLVITARTLHFKTTAGSEFDLNTDDSGDVTVTVKTGKALKVKADHVDLGNTALKKLVNETFLSLYNAHTQLGNLGFPTGVPVVPMTDPLHLTQETTAG